MKNKLMKKAPLVREMDNSSSVEWVIACPDLGRWENGIFVNDESSVAHELMHQ